MHTSGTVPLSLAHARYENIIGASLSEPHTSGSPKEVSCRRPFANNLRKKQKTLCRRPCHSEINGVDYRTSLFVSYRRPCRCEINGIDYRTSLFASCHRPCHGEINGVDFRTSCRRPCEDHAIEEKD